MCVPRQINKCGLRPFYVSREPDEEREKEREREREECEKNRKKQMAKNERKVIAAINGRCKKNR